MVGIRRFKGAAIFVLAGAWIILSPYAMAQDSKPGQPDPVVIRPPVDVSVSQGVPDIDVGLVPITDQDGMNPQEQVLQPDDTQQPVENQNADVTQTTTDEETALPEASESKAGKDTKADRNKKSTNKDTKKAKANANSAEESDDVEDEVLSTNDGDPDLACQATPHMEPSYIPLSSINKSNNLLRKPGRADRAKGIYTHIVGKVVDENCLPVQNAIVQIWQADSVGKYEQHYEQKSEWDVKDKDFDPNFAFSGTALTNNLGEFEFLTVLPGPMDNRAPHINVSVRHDQLGNLDSRLYFDKHPKNAEDKELTKLSEKKQALLLAKGEAIDPEGQLEGRQYRVVITMKGINRFQRY